MLYSLMIHCQQHHRQSSPSRHYQTYSSQAVPSAAAGAAGAGAGADNIACMGTSIEKTTERMTTMAADRSDQNVDNYAYAMMG